jgi:hypothetical protein|tara:strand:+ start:68 stop:667 length:600 start_codon:yes stop_codon:yes gene_type:complete
MFDVHNAYGQYVATYGQDGPVEFVSNLERQTVDLVETIRGRIDSGTYNNAPVALRDEITRTNDAVLAALYNDEVPRLWVNSKECLTWGRADQGWNNRAKYKMYCLPWQDNLTAATDQRTSALTTLVPFVAQAAADAETSESLKEQTKTAEEQATDVLGEGPKPNAGLPTWTKYAIGAGVTLVAARVLLPSLFAVYLRER